MGACADHQEKCSARHSSPLRWYAANTAPHREFRAKRHLENQGFRVFLPERVRTIRHARKLTNVNAPFFPQYIFLELDLTLHRWRSVNGTFGVRSLVMQGETPLPVPYGVVDAMLASVDHKNILCFEHCLQPGSEVRLVAGAFAEQLGILDRLDNSGRIRVLLNLMGATIPVQVPREYAIAA